MQNNLLAYCFNDIIAAKEKQAAVKQTFVFLAIVGIFMDKIMSRYKKNIQKLCEALEMAVAMIVLIGILMTIFSLLSDFEIFRSMLGDTAGFKEFLEDIFVIVIGIEFLQMLCKPNSDNVMEVLIFLVARHMIIGDTTPYEDFISVISVGLLCVVRRYLHVTKEKEKERERQRQRDLEKEQEQTAHEML